MVSFGYDSTHFGPNDKVTYAQTFSFSSRAMVVKQYWQAHIAARWGAFRRHLAEQRHQNDVATFLYYTAAYGGVPDHPANGGFADWSSPSSRSWFSRALWAALLSKFDAEQCHRRDRVRRVADHSGW